MECTLGILGGMPESVFPLQKPSSQLGFVNDNTPLSCAIDTGASSHDHKEKKCTCEQEHETTSNGTGERDEFEMIDYSDCSPSHEWAKQSRSELGQRLDKVECEVAVADRSAEASEPKTESALISEPKPLDIPTTEIGQPRPPPVERPNSISIFVSPAVDSDSPNVDTYKLSQHIRRQSSPASFKKTLEPLSPKLSKKGKEPADFFLSKTLVKRLSSGLSEEGDATAGDNNNSNAGMFYSPRLQRLSKVVRNISFHNLTAFASPAARHRHSEQSVHTGERKASFQSDAHPVSHVLLTKTTLLAKHETQLERICEESRRQGAGLMERLRGIESDITSGLEPLCSHRDCNQRQLNSATKKLERAYMMVDRYVEAMYHYVCKGHTGVWLGCQGDMACADTHTGMWQAERLAIHTLLAQRRAKCLEDAHTDAKNAYKVLIDMMAMLRREQKRINKQCIRYKELLGPAIPNEAKLRNSATPLAGGMSNTSFAGFSRSLSRAKTTTLSLANPSNQHHKGGTHIKPEPIYVMHYTPAMPAPYNAVNFHGHPDPLVSGV